jgi:hypothetical protein
MNLTKPTINFAKILAAAATLFLAWFWFAHTASAANFSISPSSGNYSVGSTFDVSVLVDTKGQEINAVQMQLSFPPDMLQLVSSSAGESIIEIYTTPPKFDNSAGRVDIVGGIPNGINVPAGLISKLTFRVKGVGNAALRFTGESQVLLNDGRGTNVLDNTFGGSYKLELPPQQGPIVISDTHPDQESWYQDPSVRLQWDVGLPPASSYSYTISSNPSDVPDDTAENTGTSVTYKQVPDGINYFHIKAFRDGRWGGVSHYSLRVDTVPPEQFGVTISPAARTSVKTPLIIFSTSDKYSGVDHYEIKIVPLKIEGRTIASIGEQLFVNAESPYQSEELLNGTYDVVVRAYDKVGNIQEVTRRLEISDSWLWFLGQDGVVMPLGYQMSWMILLSLLLLLILLLLLMAYFARKWYRLAHQQVVGNRLPDQVALQLEELQKYRTRYGKMVAVLICMITLGTMWLSPELSLAQTALPAAPSAVPVVVPAQAQATPVAAPAAPQATEVVEQGAQLTPPVVTSHSANIKDDEIFYVSGRTTEPDQEVVVHLQSMVDGGAFDFTTVSDKRGDWTYRHDDFLAGGKYILWAHAKDGEKLSSPSPQVEMDVKPIALNWGNSRITYQSLYIGAITALLLLIIVLLLYIIIHAVLVRRRRLQFAESLRQAEDSIKRGFIALRRDIEAELVLIKQAHLPADLAGEQKVREQQLEEDLKNIESLVGKEVWEVETFEKLPGPS